MAELDEHSNVFLSWSYAGAANYWPSPSDPSLAVSIEGSMEFASHSGAHNLAISSLQS